MNKFFYSKIARGAGMVGHYALLMVFTVCYYCMRSNGIRYENLDTFEESQAYADVLDEQVRGLLLYLEAELGAVETGSSDTAAADTAVTEASFRDQNKSLVENRFLMNHSNIKYQLYSMEGKLLLSNDHLEEADLKKLGNFIVLDFVKDMVDTDYIGSLMFSEYMQFGEDGVLKDKRLVIGIDTSYPVNDRISAAKENFFEVQDLTDFLMTAEAGVYTLLIFCYAYLTFVTGQKEKGGKVTLRPLDHLPLELVLAASGASIAVLSFFLYRYLEMSGISRFSLNVGSMLAVGINTFILFPYLSIVRRIKAKAVWKYSLLKKIAEMVQRIKKFKYASLQTVLTFVIFLAINYAGILYGGWIGKILLLAADLVMGYQLIHWTCQRREMYQSINMINKGELENYQLDITHFRKGPERELARAINSIGDSFTKMLQENIKGERMKAELITNVSHDIKTPLTSIINYVDLMKQLEIQNPQAGVYLSILDEKSQRLKHLAEDLVEASRISTGNIKIEAAMLDFREMILQAAGEYEGTMQEMNLELVTDVPKESVYVMADNRYLWRVVDNLYTNAVKYSMRGTRVYADLSVHDGQAVFELKNISRQPLNIKAEDLTERFIRGDIARNTEENGLGLSIAKDLTEIQGGSFKLILDGDLFKVILDFPVVSGEEPLD